MDFTLKIYGKLLQTFLDAGYQFITFAEYCRGVRVDKMVILRHDVDECAGNALEMARLEHRLGICATYYFRIVKQSNVPDIIRKVVELGHELGYHYETLSDNNGDMDSAIMQFKNNLDYFRTYYPVVTVCMHGSSTSKFDNRDIWKSHNLNDFGLIGEPYLSTNFDEVFYMTDTGYAWDGGKYAVRDIVENRFDLSFHSTKDVILSVKGGTFPKQSMILAHTLWTSRLLLWLWLYLREKMRNNIKLMAKDNKVVSLLYSWLVRVYWKQNKNN